MLDYKTQVDQVYAFIKAHKKSDIRACEAYLCQARNELPIRYAESAAIFGYIEMGMNECSFTGEME